MMRAAGLLLLGLTASALASPPDFFRAVDAHAAGDYPRCAGLLLELEARRAPLPANGEALGAACLTAAGRTDEAFAYLRRQLSAGRLPLERLRSGEEPGLPPLRADPQWPAFLSEAEAAQARFEAGLDPGLRQALLERAARDQQARADLTPAADGSVDPERWRAVEAVDQDNTRWLKDLVLREGWPSPGRVGHDGARAAWMLVQHADADPEFQRHALELMEPGLADGSVAPDNFALLTDRVRLAQGQPQRYGTQFETGADGVLRLRPVEDPAGLDDRRAAVGLPPMAEYRRVLGETYGLPVE